MEDWKEELKKGHDEWRTGERKIVVQKVRHWEGSHLLWQRWWVANVGMCPKFFLWLSGFEGFKETGDLYRRK